MSSLDPFTLAVLDYGVGNLFSIKQACLSVGLDAVITSDRAKVLGCDGVILPGVGAFGPAMDALRSAGLVEVVHEVVERETHLFGICLGMQLLMTSSSELGQCDGLNLIPGPVEPLPRADQDFVSGSRLKVPQVGWRSVFPTAQGWSGSALEGLTAGVQMYFVHSFFAQPDEPSHQLATARHGHMEYAAAVRRGKIFGFQFHPEKSGTDGLAVYRNIRKLLAAD